MDDRAVDLNLELNTNSYGFIFNNTCFCILFLISNI